MNSSGWQFTPFILPVAGAAILLAMLAVYAWGRRRAAPGTLAFIALVSLTAWWSFTYSLELATSDPATMLLWVKLEWIGIALLPVAWLLFALYYAGYPSRTVLWIAPFLLVIPLLAVALAWTSPAQSLLYANIGVNTDGPFVAFSADRGPAFYLHVVYAYVLFLIAAVLIFRAWRRAEGVRKQQAFVVLIGAVLPFIGNAIYQIGLLAGWPLYIDLTVPAFAASAVLFTWGWFRLELSDLVPDLGAADLAGSDSAAAALAQTTQLRTLNLVSVGLAVLLFIALLPVWTIGLRAGPRWSLLVGYTVCFILVLIVTLWRQGPFRLRAVGLIVSYLLLAFLDMLTYGASASVGFFFIAYVAFAALLLSARDALIAVAVGAALLAVAAMSPPVAPAQDIYRLTYSLLSLAMTGGLLLVALLTQRRDSQALLLRSRELSRELQVEREQLEQRVAERTRALETSALVSRRLSTILDQSQLVREVVEQLRVAFSYYHVHIYLWDPASESLRMVSGTGDAGQSMLVMGHALRPEQGLVGRAFSTNSAVVVPDVKEDAGWLPNPLLPDTRSEIAVPITVGDEVLGVLDVQESVPGALGQDDAQLLQTIAGQLAVTLRNARLLAQIQHDQEREALVNAINRKISQTTDMQSAMRVALVELARALEAQEGLVQLTAEQGTNGHER